MDLINLIGTEGFNYISDPSVGAQINRLRQENLPLNSEQGITFCLSNSIGKSNVRSLLTALFPRCSLGICKVLGSDPGNVYSAANPRVSKRDTVLVHLCPRGSHICYYKYSHQMGDRLTSNSREARNGFLHYPGEALSMSQPVPIEIHEGGLAILDGRLGFEIIRGPIVIVGFFSAEVLHRLKKMSVPRALQQTVEDMTDDRIGANFVFQN